MALRGRLSVLANVIGKSYDQIFKEFEGYIDPVSVQGSGDVKYHLGATGKYESPSGADVRVELAANPSHLETVDPIVLGMMRAASSRPARSPRCQSFCTAMPRSPGRASLPNASR
jgi:2-oxoglutarate dehydrogenase E1 component